MKIEACFLILLCVCCVSCGSEVQAPPKESMAVKNVVRIFMHEDQRFSVMIQDPETEVMRIQAIQEIQNVREAIYRFIPDVPETDSMWILFKYGGLYGSRVDMVEFHVHSAKDLNGAGWDHGKHGRGQVQIIE